jgi:hypothetical protein
VGTPPEKSVPPALGANGNESFDRVITAGFRRLSAPCSASAQRPHPEGKVRVESWNLRSAEGKVGGTASHRRIPRGEPASLGAPRPTRVLSAPGGLEIRANWLLRSAMFRSFLLQPLLAAAVTVIG